MAQGLPRATVDQHNRYPRLSTVRLEAYKRDDKPLNIPEIRGGKIQFLWVSVSQEGLWYFHQLLKLPCYIGELHFAQSQNRNQNPLDSLRQWLSLRYSRLILLQNILEFDRQGVQKSS